jgi:hypothetical protein
MWPDYEVVMRKCHFFLVIFGVLTLLVSIFIAACAKPAEFEVISLRVTPQEALAGNTISVATVVENVGQGEGSYSVVLYVDGLVSGTQTITLLPGAYQKVIFSLTEDKAGLHQVSVGKLRESFKIKEPTLEQLKVDYPELYQELFKLPELKEIDERDNEAIEDIIRLGLDPEYKDVFESLLNEGIEVKRKYCSPLQALLWIAYDEDFDGHYPWYHPLYDYSLSKLLTYAWKQTTTSNNYQSKEWANFYEVVDRLNSPTLVATYLVQNIVYDWEEFTRLEAHFARFASPRQTFESEKGVCNEQARFALYCLLKNGYFYDDFELHPDEAACCLNTWPPIKAGELGHTTCLYTDDGRFYVIDTTRHIGTLEGEVMGGVLADVTQSIISGPFSSIEQAANAIMPNWDTYTVTDVGLQVKTQVRRH